MEISRDVSSFGSLSSSILRLITILLAEVLGLLSSSCVRVEGPAPSSVNVLFLVLYMFTSKEWSLSESEPEDVRRDRIALELKSLTLGRRVAERPERVLSSEWAVLVLRLRRWALASVVSDTLVIKLSNLVPESRSISLIKSKLSWMV